MTSAQQVTQPRSQEQHSADKSQKPICSFYRKGNCRYGISGRGFENTFLGLVQRWVYYRSVCCLGCVDFSKKMSDIPEVSVRAMGWELCTFDSCSYFRAAFDTHDMCAPCRHKEGHQECTRESNCQCCINWSDIKWSLYECNLQQKEKRRQKKLDEMLHQFLWKTPWQLALKIQKTQQQRNLRWETLEISSSLC